MQRLQLFCLFLLGFLLPGYGQLSMAGIYERESGKTFLNCDSTFRGFTITKRDTMKSAGRWSVQGNKLIFHTDSVKYDKEKFTNIRSFLLIKDSLLCNPKVKRSGYRDTKRFYKGMCLPQRIPSFTEYKKKLEFKLKKTLSFRCS